MARSSLARGEGGIGDGYRFAAADEGGGNASEGRTGGGVHHFTSDRDIGNVFLIGSSAHTITDDEGAGGAFGEAGTCS